MEAWKELHCASCFSALPSGVSVCPKCGFDSAGMPSVAESNALPRYSFLQSRYVVGRVVGSGGFGITYSAYDTFTAARVAIKEYFPREIAVRKAETGAVVPVKREDEYADGLERFAGEAITLKDLKLCKSIVRVYELFEENGTAYMVMEYIEGINLNELAKQRGGRIPYEEAREYILSTALALSEAHAKNIIHRDISPDNIIRLPNGDVKLIDFGASKSRYKSEEGTKGPILLKQSYAPPEQYSKSGNQGPWTDIYALACTFYRIITGVRGAPLPSATERQKYKESSTGCVLCECVTEDGIKGYLLDNDIEPNAEKTDDEPQQVNDTRPDDAKFAVIGGARQAIFYIYGDEKAAGLEKNGEIHFSEEYDGQELKEFTYIIASASLYDRIIKDSDATTKISVERLPEGKPYPAEVMERVYIANGIRKSAKLKQACKLIAELLSRYATKSVENYIFPVYTETRELQIDGGDNDVNSVITEIINGEIYLLGE